LIRVLYVNAKPRFKLKPAHAGQRLASWIAHECLHSYKQLAASRCQNLESGDTTPTFMTDTTSVGRSLSSRPGGQSEPSAFYFTSPSDSGREAALRLLLHAPRDLRRASERTGKPLEQARGIKDFATYADKKLDDGHKTSSNRSAPGARSDENPEPASRPRLSGSQDKLEKR